VKEKVKILDRNLDSYKLEANKIIVQSRIGTYFEGKLILVKENKDFDVVIKTY
jgi:hypothetical protein